MQHKIEYPPAIRADAAAQCAAHLSAAADSLRRALAAANVAAIDGALRSARIAYGRLASIAASAADAAREYADGAAHDANAVFSDDADGEAARLDAQAAARSAAQAADEAEGYRQAVCAPLGYAA